MKRFFSILAGYIFMQTLVYSENDAFYVWQQQWSSSVQEAVAQETPTTLYPLACTIPAQGTAPLTNIPWQQLSELKHHYVPVIRIPLSAFRRNDLTAELDRITECLSSQMSPRKLEEIQFDLDCPERLLDRYLSLISIYRTAHPNLRLSITVLPVHLNHSIFRELAAATDFYVLQVHGIDVPKKQTDPAELLPRTTADNALRKAEAIGHPFHVALPCYAYELNFDSGSQTFLFLTAEKPAQTPSTLKRRIAASHTDLIELQNAVRTSPHAKGIIWFRLPVAGDRLCLPRQTLKTIQSGIPPEPDVHCTIHPVSSSTIELEFHNANTIHACEATINLTWPNPTGAFDLYNDLSSSRPAPGCLPTQITAPMPSPGRSMNIGWFQANTNHLPIIKIVLK